MILWIVDTCGWRGQGLWRICHTGCSKCESYQVSQIQTSEMAICKHDTGGLSLLTLQWVSLLFIVLGRKIFGSCSKIFSPVSHHFPAPFPCKREKWGCVLQRFVFVVVYRLLASGAIVWLKEHGRVSPVLPSDRVWPNGMWKSQIRVHALVRCEHGLDLSGTWTPNHGQYRPFWNEVCSKFLESGWNCHFVRNILNKAARKTFKTTPNFLKIIHWSKYPPKIIFFVVRIAKFSTNLLTLKMLLKN